MQISHLNDITKGENSTCSNKPFHQKMDGWNFVILFATEDSGKHKINKLIINAVKS